MSADVCWCQVNFEIFAEECNTFISNAAISACEKGPLTSPLNPLVLMVDVFLERGQQWKTSLQLLQQAEVHSCSYA